jgi:GR25 family glycosyltransferase involved in LPS biosynthesis
MQVRGFVIHLARAESRRGHVARLKELSPVPLAVLDAVDGRLLTAVDVARVYQPRDLLEPVYPFDIGRGEIGCFLSHRKAWQAIIDSGSDAGLVFEDDAAIDAGVFPNAFRAAMHRMDRHSFIEFQTRPMQGAVLAQIDEFRLIEPEVPPVQLSAQLIGAAAAARLLDVTERFDRPVDGVIQMLGVTQQRILCIEPSGVTDDTAGVGGTTIQRKGSDLLGQISKSWKRAAYRRAIRAHVQTARADQRV